MAKPEWDFYGRDAELKAIRALLGANRFFFCQIVGRRRIGKTTLIQRALRARSRREAFYFQVPDADERGVLESFRESLVGLRISSGRGTTDGATSLGEMAILLGAMCETGWIVVLDEFQYFLRNGLRAFASHLQSVIDRLRDPTVSGVEMGGIFVLGSIATEMNLLLEDRTSPLFNRLTNRLTLDHWSFRTLLDVFADHGVRDPAQWLFLWSLFQGVPKYYRDALEAAGAGETRRETLARLFFEPASPLRDEAGLGLLRELRGRNVSILKLLARRGPLSNSELVAEYGSAQAGPDFKLTAYLANLIEHLGLVERLDPVFADERSRKSRYAIADNFLSAWLSSIERAVQMARIQPVPQAVDRADQALQTHEGRAFEKLVRGLLEECSRADVGDMRLTQLVRGYWNKPGGTDIEIDVAAMDEDNRIVRFGSCRRSADKHDNPALATFDQHVDRFLQTREGRRLSGWTVQKALYAPVFPAARRAPAEAKGFRCYDLPDFARELT